MIQPLIKTITTLFLLCPITIWSASIYRPFDDYPVGARSAGAGGTGTSFPNSLSAGLYNPAYFGIDRAGYATITPDLQATTNDLIRRNKLKVLTMPLFGASSGFGDDWGWSLFSLTPYQRKFPNNEDFSAYYFGVGLARKLNDRMSIGANAGPLLGVQSGIDGFHATTWAGSFGFLYYYNNKRSFTAGASLFFSGEAEYAPFRDGNRVRERLPSRMQVGFSFLYTRKIRQMVELHFTDWSTSSFKVVENGEETSIKPKFETGFGNDIHLHLGVEMPLPFFAEAWLRTGFQTASYYDFAGNNEPQIQWTVGLGFIAGGKKPKRKKNKKGYRANYLFEDRLKFDFALVDSVLPSLINDENNLIELVQISAEYRFNDWQGPNPYAFKPKGKNKKKKRRSKKRRRTERIKRKLEFEKKQNKAKVDNSEKLPGTESKKNGSKKQKDGNDFTQETTLPDKQGLERQEDGWDSLK